MAVLGRSGKAQRKESVVVTSTYTELGPEPAAEPRVIHPSDACNSQYYVVVDTPLLCSTQNLPRINLTTPLVELSITTKLLEIQHLVRPSEYMLSSA